ncbi:MAG: hypothetical protein E7623_06060 [Ruminococcaceae bacterium]|nr:hypothetical protein [Oscillospiraceae bacterium]
MACCVGWPISVSMENYFKLLGLNCKKELRHKLDCGLRLTDHPNKEEYARFEPRYDGNCPLRANDGRCSLHAELGEDILPDVCRLYPRGIRAEDGAYECSCSNSCEAVLEILYKRDTSISFFEKELSINMPPIEERDSFFETLGLEQQIRLYLISIVQDRRMCLYKRLISMGDVLKEIDIAIEKKDRKMLDSLLKKTAPSVIGIDEEISTDHIKNGLEIMSQMIEVLDRKSNSIRSCGEEALKYFGHGEKTLERYMEAKDVFEKRFPNWEMFFENMLVNHMFFSCFPFQDRPESMHSEHMALCSVYALLRFLGLGYTAEKTEDISLIDVMALIFRLIDHTEFDRYSSHILTKLGCTSDEQLSDILRL